MRFEEKCTDKVVDSSNKPIENAYVEAVLTNHAFGFGTAITRRAMYDSNYTKFIKDHFNWAVFENESKWYTNEPSMGIITMTMLTICMNFAGATE